MVSACAQSVISSIESSDSILSDVNSLKSITKIQSLRQSFCVFHNYRCEKQINKLNWIHKQRNNNITPAPIERMKCLFVCSEICHVDERFYETLKVIGEWMDAFHYDCKRFECSAGNFNLNHFHKMAPHCSMLFPSLEASFKLIIVYSCWMQADLDICTWTVLTA